MTAPAQIAPSINNLGFTLNDCWAKTGLDGRPIKSVAEHCEDVGLVAEQIAKGLTHHLQRLLPEGAVSLVAAHDIGKVSPGFLLKSPHWRAEWQDRLQLDADGYESRHQWVSQKFVASRYRTPPRWLMALGGHHGRYLCNEARPSENIFSPSRIGGADFEKLRDELLRSLEQLFGPLPFEQAIEKGSLLHWFTGFMVFSDWVGSNTAWFEEENRDDIASRRSKANAAIAEIGIGRHQVRPELSFSELFGLASPRPLQKTLQEAVDTPGLYIVEAPMGEGKTEAALAGAYRRWSRGHERGLYFALPTQLTSARICDRVEEFCRRIVQEDSALALVHGSARLEERPIRTLYGNRGETESSLEASRWFSDGRRSMLAPFGVGTIDQALMAVVPVRHSALRMFGLGGKVVVIDEVHSYDPFTSALVDRLVQWLLELGGTVIVLSATLTASRRASLVAAAGACELSHPLSYPMVTKVTAGSDKPQHIVVAASSSQQRDVSIEICAAAGAGWMQETVEAAEAGACVMVIRNTVDLARNTYLALQSMSRGSGVKFGLIHSRFTQSDRNANETEWTGFLGREAGQRPSTGAILVGTQVLEQSLDIDADLLVTDLAPTDLVFQRMGRLHRHHRSRPKGFEKPRCLVLRPDVDWQKSKSEVLKDLNPHRFIYPPFSLYMADLVWSRRSSVRLPEDIRTILESSTSLPETAPEAVRELWDEANAEAQKMRDAAWVNDVFKVPATDDSENARTRWGIQPSAWIVVLSEEPRTSGNNVELVFPGVRRRSFEEGTFDFDLARLLRLHAVRVPAYLVRGLSGDRPAWLEEHLQDAAIAVLSQEGNLVPWPQESPYYTFSYSAQVGLASSRRQENERHQAREDEPSWH